MASELKPELEGVGIIALGSFNPAIFHPVWFAANGLIRREEADSAQVEIVHRDAAIFATEWFSLQVVGERFALDTNDPSKALPLRDLAVGTFKILEHTPITEVVLSRNQHFRMSSKEEWDAVGHHYAPKPSWDQIISEAGMRSLTIVGKRKDDSGSVQFKIEPSVKVLPYGVYLQETQVFSSDEASSKIGREGAPSSLLAKALGEWDNFLAFSLSASQHILNQPRTKNGE